jgi:UDP-N-acetylmuramoyl-L-alanyl-D-glutamate--2,6-diaminopimelate ligase
VEGARLTGNPDVEIKQVEYDSRMVTKDCLFFAIKGYQRDGYDFVEEAKEKGAVAVLGEREHCDVIENHVSVKNARKAMADVAAKFYNYPGLKIKACGVTGTNGKTTTCYLLKSILEARNKTTGLITSLVYDTGRHIFPAERTTPESLDMQRLLYLMKNNYCVNAVIEVSSHALVLHRVDNIKFRVAVYTNLSRDHLDFHHTMEEYFAAKALLVKKLDGPLSYVVINLDVPEFRTLIGEDDTPYIGYSLDDDKADVYCSRYELQPERTLLDLVTPMGMRTVELKLPGRFNLINAVAAAAGGLAAGVDVDSVVRGLEAARPVPGRFNYIQGNQPFTVYVDYAHTPDAIERLCESAREITDGRLLILFGCGGDRDRGKRSMMGKAATTAADYAVVTSDNPRGEDPLAIIEDIKPGLVPGRYEIIPDRRQAITAILKMAKPGDVVLLAGKGSENYQEIKGTRHPFDDTAEAKKVLAELGYQTDTTDEGN